MRIAIGMDGSFTIPFDFRKQLGVESGGLLRLDVVDGEARLRALDRDQSDRGAKGVSSYRDPASVVNVSANGMTKLPYDVRSQLGMEQGDPVLSVLEDGALLVYTSARLREYVRNMAKKYPLPDSRLASEELMRGRRAEAKLEDYG